MTNDLASNACDLLNNIRSKGPLVWNFSNFVSMDIAANALLAIGASPAMAHAKEEANDFSQICKAINGALTINIGTFDPYWQECAKEAAKQASQNEVPWVLDPVGAGASKFRNQNVVELMKFKPTILRGNGSEIMAVAGIAGGGKGVDSTSSSNEALDAAKSIATMNNIIVAVTGETDYVTDGKKTYSISGGHEMMTKVTATGCALTCLIKLIAVSSSSIKVKTSSTTSKLFKTQRRSFQGIKALPFLRSSHSSEFRPTISISPNAFAAFK